MINQVCSNSSFKYSFVPFKGENGANTAVQPTYTAKPKNDDFNKNDSKDEKQKEQKTRRFGRSIAIIGLLAGLGYFLFGKTFSKGSDSIVKSWLQKLERTTTKGGRYSALKGVKQLFKTASHKAQVLFNIATLKDILFVKTLKKLPVLRDFNKVVTDIFEKFSIRTSTKAYNKTLVSFHSMLGKFEDARKLIPNTHEDAVVRKKIQSVRDYFYDGFGEAARNQRLSKVQDGLKNLDERVWKETYGSASGLWKHTKKGEFIAAQQAEEAKLKLFNSVMDARFKITNSPLDCYHATKDLWDDLNYLVDERDKPVKALMNSLAEHLNRYKNTIDDLGGARNVQFPKAEVLADLKKLRELVKPGDLYDAEKVSSITKAIESLGASMSKTKQGEIQDIMDIYRKHLQPPEFEKLQKSVNKAMNALNKATDMEHDKLFDKIRDLKLGSAPHDVLAFMASLGLIGWGVSRSESKDEKISVTLKYGIPALVGVAMAIGCTIGLIASGPSLLIGIASTIPVNMVGKAIDNARKKKNESAQASLLPAFKLESPMQMIRDIEHNCDEKKS